MEGSKKMQLEDYEIFQTLGTGTFPHSPWPLPKAPLDASNLQETRRNSVTSHSKYWKKQRSSASNKSTMSYPKTQFYKTSTFPLS